jgi:hypothetical protein
MKPLSHSPKGMQSLNIKCDICSKDIENIWMIQNGIAPNCYSKVPDSFSVSSQNIFFCEHCQLLSNHHKFSLEDLFNDYAYRTPNTNMDEEIIKCLSDFIKLHSIKKIAEVAGNNGIFSQKLLNEIDSNDISISIIDKVTLAVSDKRIEHIDAFIDPKNAYLFEDINPDLVIVRHALAHNYSIRNFFRDIAEIFNPNKIYIENASLFSTFKKKDYSQLYSEHFYQVSPISIQYLANEFGYDVTSVNNFEIHNGSFGIFLEKNKNKNKNKNINNSYSISCKNLKKSIDEWVKQSREFWTNIASKNKEIVIWGCSAKFLFTYSALELSNIKPISYIIDSTIEKQGLYAPGTSIMVSDEDSIKTNSDNLIFIIGARNFEDLIVKKIKNKNKNASIYCPPF